MVMNNGNDLPIRTVPVAAEWALWGKQVGDTGAHLLDCSTGPLSPENFNEVLTRYSPGTLTILPEITISWMTTRDQQSYLGIAIHDTASHTQYDAGGRKIVLTSYYCVPFTKLAAGAVSYRTMYETFRAEKLPLPSREPIQAKLTGVLDDTRDEFAIHVAALLLSCKPVCILGAEKAGVSVDGRLHFLDLVASLLPYGMRSQLSASTWTSSTSRNHRLRLFFSSASRQEEDQVVTWNQPDPRQIPLGYPREYLSWLHQDVPGRAAILAGNTQEIAFRSWNVVQVLEGLDGASRFRSPVVPSKDVALRHSAVPTTTKSIDELLMACVAQLGDTHPYLTPIMDDLEEHLHTPPAEEKRAQYRQVIQRYRLLRENMPIEERERSRLYDVLLRLCFEIPYNYQAYCSIESYVLGDSLGGQLHESLLLAMLRHGLDTLTTKLLVLAGVREEHLEYQMRAYPPQIDELLYAAAGWNLHPPHARLVCPVALRQIFAAADRYQMLTLRQALHSHGYLASALNRIYPDEPEVQRTWLNQLLDLAYDHELDRMTIQSILANTPLIPTTALLVTLLPRIDRTDAQLTEDVFIRSLITNTGFPAESREQALAMLPDITVAEAKNDEGENSRARPFLRPRSWSLEGVLSVLYPSLIIILVVIMVVYIFRHY